MKKLIAILWLLLGAKPAHAGWGTDTMCSWFPNNAACKAKAAAEEASSWMDTLAAISLWPTWPLGLLWAALWVALCWVIRFAPVPDKIRNHRWGTVGLWALAFFVSRLLVWVLGFAFVHPIMPILMALGILGGLSYWTYSHHGLNVRFDWTSAPPAPIALGTTPTLPTTADAATPNVAPATVVLDLCPNCGQRMLGPRFCTACSYEKPRKTKSWGSRLLDT